MKKSIFIILILLICSSTFADDAAYDKALELFNNEKYKDSFKAFMKLAEEGHLLSIEYIGYMYEYGYGVKQDYKKSREWFEKGAEKGSDYSQNHLGYFYYYANGVKQDYKKAYNYFYESAEAENVNSMSMVGYMYEKGNYVRQDYKKAIYWFKKASDEGDDFSQNHLGYIYYDGKGVPRDLKKSLEYFLLSSKSGNVNSMDMLGFMYEFGYGTDINYSEAKKWYEKAMEKDSAYSVNGLAGLYFDGKGVVQNRKKAFELFMKAAEMGNLTAKEYIGYMYEFGYGIEQDYKKALEWYEKAAKENSSYALHGMGIIYFDGKGVEKDTKKAFEYFERASEYGKYDSMEFLGYMYEFGDGVEQDYKKALEWYKQAAENNSSYAQARLGIMYFEGKGTGENYDEAYKWLNKAAGSGEEDAKATLEELLATGYQPKKFAGKKDKNPPVVYINYSKTPKKVTDAKITVYGNAIDESGVALIYVNEKEAKLDEKGNFQVSILLKMGENDVSIIAYDIYENESRDTFKITRHSQNETPEQTEPKFSLNNWYNKQYALVIGISKYESKDIPDLNNALGDAQAISKILKKSNYEVVELLGNDATKRNILKQIKSLKNKIKPNDAFVFYFAGHGQALETVHGDKRVGYIIPYDADLDLSGGDIIDYDEEAISLDQLKKYIHDIPAKHIALLLDSCFSGLAMENRGLRPKRKEGNKEYYESLLKSHIINILTAGDDQPVSDGGKHSPFTRSIIMALGDGNVDISDNDGFATFSELAIYVKKKVEKITEKKQSPQYDNISDGDGDFLFLIGN